MPLANQNQSVTSTITCYKMDDKKIIEDVRSFPCLWQVTNRSYKDAIQQSKEQHSLSHFLVFDRRVQLNNAKWHVPAWRLHVRYMNIQYVARRNAVKAFATLRIETLLM